MISLKPRMVSFSGTYFALIAGKLLATEKGWLRKRCTFAGAGYDQLILVGQLVHTYDGDDILQPL